jgi:AcrR family transcriptional regulator
MATAQQRYSAADRRQQILNVARKLFARRGFQGATTREIAAGARVNEAIIFRHFPSKEDLYWAVLQRECEGAGGIQAFREKLRTGPADDRELFTAIGRDILERRSQDATLSRLLLFSALENHRLSQKFFQTYLAEYFDALAGHICQGIEQGRFRKIDPLLAARGFLGMIVYHSWVQELFAWREEHSFDNADVAENMTDIWLAGILQKPAARAAGKNGRNGSSIRKAKPNGNASGKR